MRGHRRAEAYVESSKKTRKERVTEMLEHMGVSVISGAISTLGCMVWMFAAPNTFFFKFATFMCTTIFLSCVYALVFFPAMLAIIGPEGRGGNLTPIIAYYTKMYYGEAKEKVRKKKRKPTE